MLQVGSSVVIEVRMLQEGSFVVIELNMLQEGSFVVIEEDNHCMPFTPYTILVVHDSLLKKIPVVKHKSSRQGKVRYTLAGVAVPKLVYISVI